MKKIKKLPYTRIGWISLVVVIALIIAFNYILFGGNNAQKIEEEKVQFTENNFVIMRSYYMNPQVCPSCEINNLCNQVPMVDAKIINIQREKLPTYTYLTCTPFIDGQKQSIHTDRIWDDGTINGIWFGSTAYIKQSHQLSLCCVIDTSSTSILSTEACKTFQIDKVC